MRSSEYCGPVFGSFTATAVVTSSVASCGDVVRLGVLDGRIGAQFGNDVGHLAALGRDDLRHGCLRLTELSEHGEAMGIRSRIPGRRVAPLDDHLAGDDLARGRRRGWGGCGLIGGDGCGNREEQQQREGGREDSGHDVWAPVRCMRAGRRAAPPSG